MHLMNPREEAAALMEYHQGDKCMASCMNVLSQHFLVIQNRSQLLLSLAALVLTITGFSGPKIAATNLAARLLMVTGIAIDLVAIVFLLMQALTVRWSTQIRGSDDLETLELIIGNRNRKTARYAVSLLLLVLALSAYIGSVVIYLLRFPGV